MAPNAVPRRQRWNLMRELGRMIQQIHAAGCCLLDRLPGKDESVPLFSVNNDGASKPRVFLTRIDAVRLYRRSRDAAVVRDFLNLRRGLNTAGLSRTDELRVILAYLGQKRLTADGKHFVRRVESLHRKEAHA
jgi:hypothetical protein